MTYISLILLLQISPALRKSTTNLIDITGNVTLVETRQARKELEFKGMTTIFQITLLIVALMPPLMYDRKHEHLSWAKLRFWNLMKTEQVLSVPVLQTRLSLLGSGRSTQIHLMVTLTTIQWTSRKAKQTLTFSMLYLLTSCYHFLTVVSGLFMPIYPFLQWRTPFSASSSIPFVTSKPGY